MRRIILFLALVLLLVACGSTPAEEPTVTTVPLLAATAVATEIPTPAPTLPAPVVSSNEVATSQPAVTAAAPAAYVVLPKANAQNPLLTDIFIRNEATGEETLWGSLENVYKEHYHAGEYHNGHLYIIHRLGYDGYPDEEWTDELWRYENPTSGRVLFSQQGLDFRVAPTESYAAVAFGTPPDARLFFVDVATATVAKEFAPADVGGGDFYYFLDPVAWTADGTTYWGKQTITVATLAFFKIQPGSWTVNNYDVVELAMSEKQLNPNTGRVVFSDYPAMFDVDSVTQFEASKAAVTLFVYDLNSQALQTIATSEAKKFEPNWLNDQTIEYNDPLTGGRTTFTLP